MSHILFCCREGRDQHLLPCCVLGLAPGLLDRCDTRRYLKYLLPSPRNALSTCQAEGVRISMQRAPLEKQQPQQWVYISSFQLRHCQSQWFNMWVEGRVKGYDFYTLKYSTYIESHKPFCFIPNQHKCQYLSYLIYIHGSKPFTSHLAEKKQPQPRSHMLLISFPMTINAITHVIITNYKDILCICSNQYITNQQTKALICQ